MYSASKGTLLQNPCKTYNNAVWDPYTQANIYNLQMVQRRAARFVFQKYRRNVSPSVLITELAWETLAKRRARSKAILMYRIQNDLIDIPKNVFQPSNIHFRQSKAVFNIPTCRINCWKYSFVPTTVKIWNNLPMAVRDSNNLQSFKSTLADMQIRSFY